MLVFHLFLFGIDCWVLVFAFCSLAGASWFYIVLYLSVM